MATRWVAGRRHAPGKQLMGADVAHTSAKRYTLETPVRKFLARTLRLSSMDVNAIEGSAISASREWSADRLRAARHFIYRNSLTNVTVVANLPGNYRIFRKKLSNKVIST